MNSEHQRLLNVLSQLRSELARNGGKPTRHSQELEQELILTLS